MQFVCRGINFDLTLVNNGRIFVFQLGVKHFADVTDAETGFISIFADPDPDQVTLAGMHDAFHAVDEGMEFPFENRFEIGLHVLPGNFGNKCRAHLGTNGDFVEIRADDFNLMILDFMRFSGDAELEAVFPGAVDLTLHIRTADDFAFESGRVGNRNVDVRDFDLDIAGFKRGLDPVFGVFLDDQRLRNTPHVLRVVCDDREAEGDRTGAGCDGQIIDRIKGVDKSEDPLEGVLVHFIVLQRLDRAEDHRGSHNE